MGLKNVIKEKVVEQEKLYDLLVFIGRFQPLHIGHQQVIDKALKLAKNVLVLVGSAASPRTARNPFTFEERKAMIHRIYPSVNVQPINDYTYNDTAWTNSVQKTVNDTARYIANEGGFNLHGIDGMKIGLIGMEKDHSSFYLKLFPEWESVSVEAHGVLAATNIRSMLFEKTNKSHEMAVVMDFHTAQWLFNNWMTTDNYTKAREEYFSIKKYLWEWGAGPHLCADALVQVGGNILLVTRGGENGYGLLALPGGHLNKYEKFKNASIRELREETRLKVPEPVLRGSLVASKLFDDPHRSQLGRNITECFHYKLSDSSLPEVRGSDDAKDAAWYPISELREESFFDDHYHIIRYMLGL